MATEYPGAEQGRAVGARADRPARSRTSWRARSRWLVHLALLVFVAAAFGTLQLLHVRNAIHADVGLAFAALVIVHLAQRRRRITRMLAQLMRLRPRVERSLRSLGVRCDPLDLHHDQCRRRGILDWGRGAPLILRSPMPFDRWHLTSSAVVRVLGRPYLAPAKTSPTAHDPIARGACRDEPQPNPQVEGRAGLERIDAAASIRAAWRLEASSSAEEFGKRPQAPSETVWNTGPVLRAPCPRSSGPIPGHAQRPSRGHVIWTTGMFRHVPGK